MEQRDIRWVIRAHTEYPTQPSKAFRKWDEKTPYSMHPIWCASMIATETSLDEKTREEGIQVLLYHDVLEDTTLLLPQGLSLRVVQLIHEMTFGGGSKQEMQEIWGKPREIKLYKLYDKVSNLLDGSWMDDDKWNSYSEYTRRLCDDVKRNYLGLNITRIAREIAKNK